MTNLVEKLRLAEQAAEDIYFAKIDRELIAALQRAPRTSESLATPSTPPSTPETEDATKSKNTIDTGE